MVIRTPIRVLASPSPGRAAAALAHGDVGVALYNVGHPELPGLGADLLKAATCLPPPASQCAWDFLSISLAVHAADRFVMRHDFPDGWTRMIALEVELAEPEPWNELAEDLSRALRFLSGDIWYLRFRKGGQETPEFLGLPNDRDCACLFSGGLDSLVGALDLVSVGRRPLLVSQASPKEGPVQVQLAASIGLAQDRFSSRASERWRQPYEASSRTRSLLFIAYGVLAASALSQASKELIVPENGLIAINPPLTRRHLGSLSTRTTHPHFMSSLQNVLDRAGLEIKLVNPYSWKTKGEMLAECRSRLVEQLATRSYSCGKGKRLNQQCGRCVPCLIRRAAFRHAGVSDTTGYWAEDLPAHAANEDVAAARFAAAALAHSDVARWAAESGPLPHQPDVRNAYTGVVQRGISELREFLGAWHWP